MPVHRFFSTASTIEDEEFHHLIHVMRNEVGDLIELVDGRGSLSIAKITGINKKAASLEILSTHTEAPPAARYSLVQGIPQGTKIEWVLEKGTELDIDDFVFFGSKDFSTNKLSRFHHILVAAMKQCGRLFLPTLSFYSSLEEIPLHKDFCYGDFQGDKEVKATQIVIGPESGFSKEEREYLKQKGRGVSLGRHVLRTETAAVIGAYSITRNRA
jgi:16S rRNA (uracil1498-N3)-methyltransferase